MRSPASQDPKLRCNLERRTDRPWVRRILHFAVVNAGVGMGEESAMAWIPLIDGDRVGRGISAAPFHSKLANAGVSGRLCALPSKLRCAGSIRDTPNALSRSVGTGGRFGAKNHNSQRCLFDFRFATDLCKQPLCELLCFG